MHRKNTKLGMTPKELQAHADNIGVTTRTIREYVKQGLDLNDPEAIASYQAREGKQVDPNRAKKLKAEADKITEQAKIQKIKRMELEGSLVSFNDVKEADVTKAAVLSAKLSQLINEIPSMVAGLDAKQMTPILREYIHKLKVELSEYDYTAEINEEKE